MESTNPAAFISKFSPLNLWHYYREYLWDYKPNSWVYQLAGFFRVISFLLVFPIIVLALLDISSYVIARSLGVIDDVKASTSDKATIHGRVPPAIRVDDSSATSPGDTSPSTPSQHHTDSLKELLHVSQPDAYYASEDHVLKLSGVGVFSPAASQPSSPTLSRKQLSTPMDAKFGFDLRSPIQDDADGLVMRRRKDGAVPSLDD
ncbi:hypothetical protein BDN72DRAFT_956226 [Pluteus cervinus]|uniref:Uncharacterized protein n=1 Tax=Pluteus cervinus TaxID=181527 RepID=A0ACD3B6Z6_9AGAR|nr:hypothetical protein BDN72DRAFT_956226 [Pluteus cervinus]